MNGKYFSLGNFRLSAVCVIFMLMSTPFAQAAIITDQSQMVDDQSLASLTTSNLAQSFQQSTNNITGAALKLDGTGPVNFTITLSDMPSGGSVLATGMTTVLDVATLVDPFVEVDFGGPVLVVPDTTLYLLFSGNSSDVDARGTNGSIDQYGRGSAFGNTPQVNFPTTDFAFKTFTDTVVAVPEPSSLICMSTVAGLAIARLRKNKTLSSIVV